MEKAMRASFERRADVGRCTVMFATVGPEAAAARNGVAERRMTVQGGFSLCFVGCTGQVTSEHTARHKPVGGRRVPEVGGSKHEGAHAKGDGGEEAEGAGEGCLGERGQVNVDLVGVFVG